MHRLLAAVFLALIVAAPAQADTSIIISGGGVLIFSHSGSARHFHRDHGVHWRKSHRSGEKLFFHRLPRHHDRALRSLPREHGWPREHDWTVRRALRSWDHGLDRHRRKHARPQVIILVPGSFDSRIMTDPGLPSFGAVFERRSGHQRLVLLPPLKPGRNALSD